MAAIGQRLAVAHPDTNRSITPRVQRFEAIFVGPDAALTYGALWAGVGVLVAIAVANLSTLLLARGAARSRQAAIQLALGAGRARILGQQLCESLLLSIGGGLVGWVVATAMLRAYGAIAVPPTQAWAAGVLDYRVDGRVVAYLVMVSAVAGMAAGWFPGLRSLALDPLTAIRDGARGTAGGHRARSLDRVAIVAQVALAVILIAAAGVLVRSVIAVHTRSLGYDPAASLVTLTMPPAARYPSVESQLAFYDRAMAQLRTLPGVETVGYSDAGVGGTRVAVEVEGALVIDPDERPEVRSLAIGGDYFQSLGTSLVSGRDLTGEDGTGTRPVLIVNRAFEARHFGTDSALGQRVRLAAAGSSGPWLTIVGIAPDLAHGDRVRAAVEPTVYLPLRMRPGRGAWLVLRTTGTPSALVNAVRRELQAVDRDVPVWLGPFTLQEWLASSYWRRGINSGLFSVFGFLALVLAASGLFAVTAGTVARRTREIGVRIAMGATARDIHWLVVRDSAMPAALGLAIGLLGSMATNQWLRAELTGVAPVDPVTLGAAAVLIVASGAVGCLLPASRAARADPLAAIRLD
jgi:predicted permease